MKTHHNKTELLRSAPIPQALLAMGLPTMAGMMVNAFYNLADAYFVGGLGERQMGAISVVYPLGQVIIGLGLLFGNGAASYISRLLGAENREKAEQAASTALYGSLCAGAGFILLSICFLKPVLLLLGATESILPFALTYARIYIASCMFSVFNVTMNNIAASEGAAARAMWALMAGAGLNIILDPIFIYALGFSVTGAAMATALAQMVSTGIYLDFILRKKSLFLFRPQNCRFSQEMLAEILKIGVPTLVFQILTSLSISLINTQAKVYSDSVIAGMGVVTRLMAIGSLSVFGFIKGFQPIAGYCFGARNHTRLKAAIKTSIVWSTIFCVLLGLALSLFSEAIVSQFTQGDPLMIQMSAASLRVNGLSFMFFGFYTVYSCLLLALGKGAAGLLLGACRQGLCLIPVILLLPKLWGLPGILYAQPLADAASFIIALFMAARLHRELRDLDTAMPL